MFWRLEEARLIQTFALNSAADAESQRIPLTSCPDGKCWIVTAFGYIPSAAETRIVSVEKVNANTSTNFAVLNPISVALNPAYLTFIEQGMEYILFPGEYLLARRDDHTVGSTMNLAVQLIEIDLPLYTYDEPQVVLRQSRALSTLRQMVGGASAASSPGSRIDRTRTPGERTKA